MWIGLISFFLALILFVSAIRFYLLLHISRFWLIVFTFHIALPWEPDRAFFYCYENTTITVCHKNILSPSHTYTMEFLFYCALLQIHSVFYVYLSTYVQSSIRFVWAMGYRLFTNHEICYTWPMSTLHSLYTHTQYMYNIYTLELRTTNIFRQTIFARLIPFMEKIDVYARSSVLTP